MNLKLVFLLFPAFAFSQISFEKVNEKTLKLVSKYQEKENIPGMAISVSYNDTLIFSEGFGFADLENKIPVNPSKTKFDIASITKTITAATLGRLKELNLVDFNKSVYDYLDSLPKKKYDFTVKQVAGHISGLKRYPTGEDWSTKNTYSIKDFYKIFQKDELLFEPGTEHKYSNYGYKMLGLIIESVYKKHIFQAQEDFVIDKLGMKNTVAYTNNSIENSTKFYVREEKKIVLSQDWFYNDSAYAEGLLLSTSEDLIKLGNGFLYAERLLRKETLVELITSQRLKNNKKTHYGIGFQTYIDKNGNFFYGHGGNAIGARGWMYIYPKSKLVVVVLGNLSQSDDAGLVTDIAKNYIDLIKKQL